MINRCTEWIE